MMNPLRHLALLGGLSLALTSQEARPCSWEMSPVLLSPQGGGAARNVHLIIANESPSAVAQLSSFRLERELDEGGLEAVPITARALRFNGASARVELVPTRLLEPNASYRVTSASSRSWSFTTGDSVDGTAPEFPEAPTQYSEPYLPSECAREYDSCGTYDMGFLTMAFPPTSEFVTYDVIDEKGELIAERVESLSRAVFSCGGSPTALLYQEWVVPPGARVGVRAVDASGNVSAFRELQLEAVCEVDPSSCEPDGKPIDQFDGGATPMPPPRPGSGGGKLGCTAVHAAFSGVLVALVLPLFRRRRSAKR